MQIPPEHVNAGKPRILIVDDEPENRRLFRKLVENKYPTVAIDEAPDGLEAVHNIRTHAPDLVILDLHLPGISGLQVCRIIREEQKGKIKVLAITGHNTDDSRRQALEAGADDFLGKPFMVKELAQKIEELLSRDPSA